MNKGRVVSGAKADEFSDFTRFKTSKVGVQSQFILVTNICCSKCDGDIFICTAESQCQKTDYIDKLDILLNRGSFLRCLKESIYIC